MTFVEHTKLTAMVTELTTNEPESIGEKKQEADSDENLKRKTDETTDGTPVKVTKVEECDKRKDKKEKDSKASDILVGYMSNFLRLCCVTSRFV